MSSRINTTNDAWEQLPADLPGLVEARMAAGETPLAWLETDLDGDLHYAHGLMTLTDRQLVVVGPIAPSDGDGRAATNVQAWPLDAIGGMRVKEHAGVGMLEVLGPENLLCRWRYTIGRAPIAHRLADRFERWHAAI